MDTTYDAMTAVLTRARTTRQRAAQERGSVAVEFALVLPLLVMLLLGVTTMGLAYFDRLALTNAVRESSRLGSAIDYSNATSGVTPTSWADSVQQRVRQAYNNRASALATTQVCVVLLASNGTTVLASPTAQGTSCGNPPTFPASVPSGGCVVEVYTQKPATVTLGILPNIAFKVSSQSVAYYGRSTASCNAP